MQLIPTATALPPSPPPGPYPLPRLRGQALIRAVRLAVAVGAAMLAVVVSVKLGKPPNYFLTNSTVPTINVAFAGVLVAALALSWSFFVYRLYRCGGWVDPARDGCVCVLACIADRPWSCASRCGLYTLQSCACPPPCLPPRAQHASTSPAVPT